MSSIENEPGITKLEDGRLRVRTTAKNPKTGKIDEKQRTLTSDADLMEAIQVRENLKAEIRGEAPNGEPNVPITVADYAVQWMQRKAKRLKPRTKREYYKTLKDRVLPQIGPIKLSKFGREDVIGWIEWAQARTNRNGDPMATSTVRGWWRVARCMLRDADADGYLERDYTKRVPTIETGRKDVRQYDALTPDELGDLIVTAPEVMPQRAAEIATLALTGMRSGEMWALRWDDIRHDERRIYIEKSVSDGEIVDSPKTGHERIVPMPDPVSRAIRWHNSRQMREQARGYRLTELVYPSTKGTPRLPGSLRKALAATTRAAGIDKRVTPQTLRRAWNTLLEEAGVGQLVKRDMMGHSSSEMSAHYQQSTDEQKHNAADAVLQLIGL